MEDTEDTGRVGYFAIMWDSHGLEAVQPIPDPAMQSWRALQNLPPQLGPNLNHWRLRAKFNPQRFYEIYVISAVPGIEKEDIERMFEDNPQGAADTIRRIGERVYGERMQEDRIVIR